MALTYLDSDVSERRHRPTKYLRISCGPDFTRENWSSPLHPGVRFAPGQPRLPVREVASPTRRLLQFHLEEEEVLPTTHRQRGKHGEGNGSDRQREDSHGPGKRDDGP